ncbi:MULTISPECIES: UDP-N-acetylmuramoyl-L-alanine--D-glutamate ligase [Oceanobacillus]|uniref:UDP-N-acetylmuramoylalanine--D-glutamate ligase n=1 Tax=Oceanobacillus kimchii TaxID=746691 RepID=A0ABQ5TJI9_9BACI|nr:MULTISPECIES: UDP-N-acetylmuramoyl-L-alanine--D-glutamate ligase [Oceanobacillus]MBT2598798.1 UDP-N-acetylmuramoyl-L-alanine--D-glutamate ligase [Oceanobacillus sp. ISL-74]MBT2651717.1 UDP-N-acetylmuramoyl-L-alanine--D-glutamate ligase [Oceanobacillus sp. ISL-73]GLO65906.1 UDP-N-acetylmuramoylalanine--D-glutamate ligase [Oceanobacillus kimchii]
MNVLTNFPYQHVLVLGLAKSGTAAATVLLENHIQVTINDGMATLEDSSVQKLQTMGAELVLGSHPLSVLDEKDIIVKNPGIRYDNVIVEEAERRGIPVISEVELVHYLTNQPVIGITGSNGKTTTTTLITEMLRQSNVSVKVAGNIGVVATEVASSLQPEEKMVMELSSFQLQGTNQLQFSTAVLLNLFEAHLDYHGSFDNYVQAKCNIFKNQNEHDYLIYNADDDNVSAVVKTARATKVPFSSSRPFTDGAWMDDEFLYFKDEKIIAIREIVLVGKHNMENILAAIATAKLNGASNEGIYQVLTTFSGVKHRLEFVGVINGRYIYNDSKATNILATKKALAAFNKNVVLLAGGLDRGNTFEELIPYLHHVKAMVVFGETANKLKDAGVAANVPVIEKAFDVQQAVEVAFPLTDEKDTLLLSPACASWDQYKTFEERGDMFIQAVHRLK